MSRADLEREAEEKWREYKASGAVKHHGRAKSHFIAAYIQGRLDQAEADARIAETRFASEMYTTPAHAGVNIAAAIRKGVDR
jgi:hypothetical protein